MWSFILLYFLVTVIQMETRKYNGHCAIWSTLYHFFHLNLMFPFEDTLLIPYPSLWFWVMLTPPSRFQRWPPNLDFLRSLFHPCLGWKWFFLMVPFQEIFSTFNWRDIFLSTWNLDHDRTMELFLEIILKRNIKAYFLLTVCIQMTRKWSQHREGHHHE